MLFLTFAKSQPQYPYFLKFQKNLLFFYFRRRIAVLLYISCSCLLSMYNTLTECANTSSAWNIYVFIIYKGRGLFLTRLNVHVFFFKKCDWNVILKLLMLYWILVNGALFKRILSALNLRLSHRTALNYSFGC